MTMTLETAEAIAKLQQLELDLDSDHERLSSTVRKAMMLAALIGEYEYQIVLQAHLAGLGTDGVSVVPIQKLPEGYTLKWDVASAIAYDRQLDSNTHEPRSLEEIENALAQAERLMALGPRYATSSDLLGARLHLSRYIARIRHRVASFIAGSLVRLANNSTATNTNISSLTGLPNLDQFSYDLQQALDHCPQDISLGFIDIDNLKSLNKVLGHDHVDTIIRKVANTLSSAINRRGTVYHRSGDEFLVILENHTASEARDFLHRICVRIASENYNDALAAGSVTVSAGVVQHLIHATGADELREAAIRANQTAKDTGKNRVYSPPPPRGM